MAPTVPEMLKMSQTQLDDLFANNEDLLLISSSLAAVI